VVADLVALARNSLHEADVFRGLGTDEHEGALDVFLFQDVEDFRRPLGIGAVVEGDGHLVGVVSIVFDGVSAGIHVHVLIHDELLARIFFVGVNRNSALAGLGQTGDAHDVALAFDVEIVAGLHGVESLQRLRRAGLSQTLQRELSS